MSTLPKILICGIIILPAMELLSFLIDALQSIGSHSRAHDDVHTLFNGIAQVIVRAQTSMDWHMLTNIE